MIVVNATVLGVVFFIFSKWVPKPDWQTLFYTALAIGGSTALLNILLFPEVGWIVVVPNLALGVYIIMRLCGTVLLHAILILITYQAILLLIPI
jgi:hypothetical protein